MGGIDFILGVCLLQNKQFLCFAQLRCYMKVKRRDIAYQRRLIEQGLQLEAAIGKKATGVACEREAVVAEASRRDGRRATHAAKQGNGDTGQRVGANETQIKRRDAAAPERVDQPYL